MDGGAPDRIRAERDFYRRLIELDQHADIEPLLRDALALALEVTAAKRALLEVWADGDPQQAWSTAHALSKEDVDQARAAISTGVVAEALRSGQIVHTPLAAADPRFSHRASVRRQAIEAALCAPIGGARPVGVVYLQGRDGGGPFSEEAVQNVGFLARHVAPYAERLVKRSAAGADPTRVWRARLKADEVVGRSQALAETLRSIALVAPLDLTVLLSGPTGAGKTLFARVLHASSPRATEPFVELNCAAIPENLVESELFGAERGAHSTATHRREGKVEAAGRGTLFLDEVGELALPAQAKLLQLLQSQAYYPLGSSAPRAARCRIVAASNRDLRAMVDAGTFREDLFYRLDVFNVRVAGLDERPEDVVPLARSCLEQACRDLGIARLALSSSAETAVATLEWPGNIRELQHAIQRAAVFATGEGSQVVRRRHILLDGADEDDHVPSFQEATRAFQRDLLERTLRDADGNVSEAARRLDLARSHVYNLMRTFGLR